MKSFYDGIDQKRPDVTLIGDELKLTAGGVLIGGSAGSFATDAFGASSGQCPL
jgi:hypothetical protein